MLVLSVLTSVSLQSQTSRLGASLDSPECQAWVDSVYSTLSPRQRIAQLVIANVAPDQGEKSKAAIRTYVKKNGVGGLIFSKGSADEFAEMTNYAQSISDVPLFMGIDGEWGPSMRVTDAPKFPYNMNLGAVQDPGLLYRFGEEVGRECKLLGVQADFAPVLDVNSNPLNPVIGRRSFGEDPLRVSKAGVAFMLGIESQGVMAVGKHFPGHGDTSTDSHKTLPTVDHSTSTLQSVDLMPFSDFIKAGGSGIMTGHLSVPALDKSGKPSSMSKKIVTDLLKNDMGFNGLVFTDGLAMKGAAVKDNICVAALLAGNDMLLGPVHVEGDIDAVEKAVASGRIKQSVIDERCRKVLAYKYVLGLDRPPHVDRAALAETLNSPYALALVQELANASITAVRNDGNILPLTGLADRSIAIVNIGATADNEFTEYCRRYDGVDVYGSKEGTFSAAAIAAIRRHDVVIAAVYTDSHAAINTLGQLKSAKALVPVFFVGAYKMSKFRSQVDTAPALIAAYDNSAPLRKAAAMAVFGGINVSGRMPVNVEGIARLGEGVSYEKTRLGFSSPAAKGMHPLLTARIDSVMDKALAAGAFPGAQVMVIKDGDIIVDQCFGHTTRGGEKVTPATLYDLASMSKAVGTLPGVMKAYDMGLFDLDTPASKYIPGLNVEGKSDITPRMLLLHETGIPAALDVYTFAMDSTSYTGRVVSGKRDRNHTVAINGGGYGSQTARLRSDIYSKTRSGEYHIPVAAGIYASDAAPDSVMAAIYRIKLRPTRKTLYSCLNFCLLMDMEQRLTGKSHDTFVDETIWQPLGASSLTYRPLGRVARTQIAATENDTYLRKQHLQGYVHDETAAFSGGVQGNAGVFGNATDVAKICQMWLNGGTYGGERVLSEATVDLFTKYGSANSHRGLGFDKPNVADPDKSSTSEEAPAETYGHTGFTGTCFWVDPVHDLVYIFLSNRIDPSRKNPAWSQAKARSTIQSIIYQCLPE